MAPSAVQAPWVAAAGVRNYVMICYALSIQKLTDVELFFADVDGN